MQFILDEVEVRILGSLAEKQSATPEYYPLTLNALVQACNQRTSREPVVNYDETTVVRGLDALKDKNLAYVFYGSASRTPKYKHLLREVFELEQSHLSLLCVLMLRGQQTLGELRERTGRLYEFSDFGEVEEALNALIANDVQPLVVRLPRQPGQKEGRFAHLLSGEVAAVAAQQAERPSGTAIKTAEQTETQERIAKLEGRIEELNSELANLKQQFDDFRNQFE